MTTIIKMSTEDYYELFGHPDADTPINDLPGELQPLNERPF